MDPVNPVKCPGSTQKVYGCDSGMAAWMAGVDGLAPGEPMRGALWESWVCANLEALLAAHWPRARLHHWAVQGRYEVDFVIEDGR